MAKPSRVLNNSFEVNISILKSHNIPDTVIQRLQSSGYYTLSKVVQACIPDLKNVLNCDTYFATNLQVFKWKGTEKCYAIMPTEWFMTAQEVYRFRAQLFKLSTGSNALDFLLGGGIESGEVTEFFGESSTGKSQLCMTLAIIVQIPTTLGGLGGKCVYIDTKKSFRPERIFEIRKSRGLEDLCNLDNVFYTYRPTISAVMTALDECKSFMKENWVPLIIVDSVTDVFRMEYPGVSDIATRQQLLTQCMQKIFEIANEFQIVAVVTNSAYNNFQIPCNPLVPYGGVAMSLISATRILMRKLNNQLSAEVFYSSRVKESSCYLEINSKGII